MRFKVLCVILILSAFFLAGCGCQHEWVEADCLNPRTCALCEKTEGEALAHDWKEADCEQPKICMRCAQTEGVALGHKWIDATCEAPRTCKICSLSEGDPLEHDYQTWWIPESNTIRYVCKVCDHQEEEANTYQNALRHVLKNTVWKSQYVQIKNSGDAYTTRGEHIIAFDDQYGFVMNLGDGEEYRYSGTWTADYFTDENETIVHHFMATDEEKKMRCNLELYLKANDEAYGVVVLDLDEYMLFFLEQKPEGEVSAPIPEETEPEQIGGRVSQEPPTIYTDAKYEVELEQALAGVWETSSMIVSSKATQSPLTKVDFTEDHAVTITTPDETYKGSWTFTGYELLENANGRGSVQGVYFFTISLGDTKQVQCTINCFEEYHTLSITNFYGENEILTFKRNL